MVILIDDLMSSINVFVEKIFLNPDIGLNLFMSGFIDSKANKKPNCPTLAITTEIAATIQTGNRAEKRNVGIIPKISIRALGIGSTIATKTRSK